MEIAVGAWDGVPFSVSEPSSVHASFWTDGRALVEACLVDHSQGPVPAASLPTKALTCQTGVAQGGALAHLDPGAYTLALRCLEPVHACEVHYRLTVEALGGGPVVLALASGGAGP